MVLSSQRVGKHRFIIKVMHVQSNCDMKTMEQEVIPTTAKNRFFRQRLTNETVNSQDNGLTNIIL